MKWCCPPVVQRLPPRLSLPPFSFHLPNLFFALCKCGQGGDSIDIWTALTQALSRALTIISGKRLPKRVLNLVLNPSLNPSLKFLVSIVLHTWPLMTKSSIQISLTLLFLCQCALYAKLYCASTGAELNLDLDGQVTYSVM